MGDELIICRECLIDGPVKASSLNIFWSLRAKFIYETYSEVKENYFQKVKNEFDKLLTIPKNSEVNLWFENDLFCQTNMWFIISLLKNNSNELNIFRVFPHIKNQNDLWKGFGLSDDASLFKSYLNKVRFGKNDIELGRRLWASYQNNDFIKLEKLSKTSSHCFQHLEEVCKAHIERFPMNLKSGRPQQTLEKITNKGITDFTKIFPEFFAKEGIYGFGDLQVKEMLKKIIS